jgi:hypothetical protein
MDILEDKKDENINDNENNEEENKVNENNRSFK